MEALSPTMEEGRIAAWKKKEGDAVKSGEVIAEVETDKAVMDLVARADGVLRKILVKEGETVPVSTLVGVIGGADEDVSGLSGKTETEKPETGDRKPETGTKATPNYILLPDANSILLQLLPLYVKNQVYRALVETAASEQGARRTAMKNATDNAGEIQGILTIAYNRARQAQITQELAEIVGGAAALAG
jgi:pyruvate/2-oxoglutarate dehydrogenase complex dihydrolipoamide acyltransferase (E2) component